MNTVDIGYCDYRLVTTIGNWDHFANPRFNFLVGRQLSACDNYQIR